MRRPRRTASNNSGRSSIIWKPNTVTQAVQARWQHGQHATYDDSNRQQQTATDSNRQQQTATDSNRQQQTATDSNKASVATLAASHRQLRPRESRGMPRLSTRDVFIMILGGRSRGTSGALQKPM